MSEPFQGCYKLRQEWHQSFAADAVSSFPHRDKSQTNGFIVTARWHSLLGRPGFLGLTASRHTCGRNQNQRQIHPGFASSVSRLKHDIGVGFDLAAPGANEGSFFASSFPPVSLKSDCELVRFSMRQHPPDSSFFNKSTRQKTSCATDEMRQNLSQAQGNAYDDLRVLVPHFTVRRTATTPCEVQPLAAL